jgi:CRISPR/Cas system CMR subunit Cmr4 (Cas7 group RAMP superfamily)
MTKANPLAEAQYIITGKLFLETPGHFGDGTQGDSIDMPLLRDKATGQPFIPGSSIAGALRSYACDYLHGYRNPKQDCPSISLLFGQVVDDDQEATLSNIRVFDSYTCTEAAEIRDGIKIDPKTGTVAEKLLFQTEVLPRNTSFSLCFELNIPKLELEDELIRTLLCALGGLEKGEIPLGARKNRGFGRCRVKDWRVKRFPLTQKAGWLEWFALEPQESGPILQEDPCDKIYDAISKPMPHQVPSLPNDNCTRAIIDLQLELEGGILVRSPGLDIGSADASHICSDKTPVLPGTSLAGVLRMRAHRIAQLIRPNKDDANAWVDSIFGDQHVDEKDTSNKQLASSQLLVQEGAFSGGSILRVNRIKIDRFTGGALENHLFDEETLYGATLDTSLELRIPYDETDQGKAKLGLLLLCVKDLVGGDLAVGGTSSVGRGYFGGGKVTVKWQDPEKQWEWRFSPADAGSPEVVSFLNDAVRAFRQSKKPPQGRKEKHNGSAK